MTAWAITVRERRAFTLALFVGVFGTAYSEGSIVGPVEFSPAEFVPGAAVTAVARLDPGAALWSEESLSSGFPDSGELGPVVLSASIEKKQGAPLLVVRFVAWRAGPGFLPDLSIGGLAIPRIRFECGSALSGGDLRAPEPLPQLDHPGLFSTLYVAGGLLLVAVVLALVAATKALPWLRAMSARRAFAKARREFDEVLDRLGARDSGAAGWAELCAGLRRFVGLRSGFDVNALTASEVGVLPADSIPGGVIGDVATVLVSGDAVRFAGDGNQRLQAGIDAARSIADRIDEACLAASASGHPDESGPAERTQALQRDAS